jgi:hypothetical protein
LPLKTSFLHLLQLNHHQLNILLLLVVAVVVMITLVLAVRVVLERQMV